MQAPSKFDRPTSNYGGQASIPPLDIRQPSPIIPHPYLAVPQPVVHALPRNLPPQHKPSHQRGDSEVTMVDQWAYGHSSRSSSYSSKGRGSMAAPAPSPRGLVPERITAPELLQRPITPSSVLALEMENRWSTSPDSRIINGDTLSRGGSLAPPPRPVTSHSPSTGVGSRLEHGIKGRGGEQSVEQGPSAWKGPSRDARLSAVLGSQGAPVVLPTPMQSAQRSPSIPKGPFVHGHHRSRSRPGFI